MATSRICRVPNRIAESTSLNSIESTQSTNWRIASSLSILSATRNQRSTLRLSSSSSPISYNPLLSSTFNHYRHFTSSSHSINQQRHSPFDLTRKLADKLNLPSFKANANQLQLLQHPKDFYDTLKDSIAKAERRIFISSLYIGKKEVELISHLRSSLSSKPSLRLLILTDALRSTRETSPSPSCASLICSLVKEFPNQVDARLWHTPKLKHGGWLKRLVGKRFNEGFGLQHMKVYGFDQDVMVSGANLSNDYFTNRRDRYLMIKNHELLSNYLHSLLLLVCRFSYALLPTSTSTSTSSPDPDPERLVTIDSSNPYSGFEMKWDGGKSLLLSESIDGSISEDGSIDKLHSEPYLEHSWKDRALKDVQDFTSRWKNHTSSSSSERNLEKQDYDTELIPLIQMGPIGITQETDAVPLIFSQLNNNIDSSSSSSAISEEQEKPIRMDLTSGYFSLYGPYKSLVLQKSTSKKDDDDSESSKIRIIAAAPESNGFFESKGVSKYLPPAYTHLEHQFWKELKNRGRSGDVEIREWKKSGWTYHAKGIWLTPESSEGPTHTLIGSSNYGSRSARLDLECSLFISTTSKDFQKKLSEEVEGLREDAVDLVNQELFDRKDRKVGLGVKIATFFVKGML